MIDLETAFRHQATSCAALGSPFMGRLCTMLADNQPLTGAIAARCAAFGGDIGPAGHSLPLRIASGLHALVLSGEAPALAAVYPPNAPDDAALRDAVLAALAQFDPYLSDWIASPPQTNEIRRSAALIAGAQVAAERFALPVVLSELGASAGLNLNWDRYALDLPGARIGPDDAPVVLRPNWTGPLPPDAAPQVIERRGVDLMPIDAATDRGRLRLLSYLWPDQPHRLEMTNAALDLPIPGIDRGDAVDWLADRLDSAPDGALHLVQNTVAWQYFPADRQARGEALMQQAGRDATPTRPLAWLQMETDGDTTGGRGAALTLRLWPGDVTLMLGRGDFHGRWIDWQGA
ncbi:DUF2332 family protein [Thalassococcus sp. CAU 1522]|uniref:DUF2332 family protein n=1 Tax=Thalassococcus arenae TaxID=2851652 RepID=A0ABS6N352_9RHOB|nr:DUF2332 family protein [Thalassococcus arenae]MBV2358441.1 DUF2332 family protein [Thalassococcus arenae]